MPRRRRVQLENRLLALEVAVAAQPRHAPVMPITDEEVVAVLAVLEEALGAGELEGWLETRGAGAVLTDCLDGKPHGAEDWE